jgi:uncharacterized protein
VTWQLALSGFLIGTLVGLTGMGGGSLMTPLLVLFFGFKPTVAIGTDIAHGALFKTVGAIRHRQLGNVQARLSGWMFLGSAPTSLLGVALAAWLGHRYGDSVENVTGRVLGLALIFGGLGLFAKNLVRPSAAGGLARLTNRDRVAAVLIGLFGGFIVGLTSVGSGTFFGLTMLILFPLGAQKMVGTDIFHAAALLYVAGAGHLIAGNVELGVVGWLLIGSIPGVILGSQWSIRLPEAVLRGALATMLMLAGAKLVLPPGAAAGTAVALGVGLAGLLAYALTRRRGQEPRRPEGGPTRRPRHELVLSSKPSPTFRNR